MTGYYECKHYDFYGDAVDIFDAVSGEPFVFFLDSSMQPGPDSRYSFIGFDPFGIFYDKGRNALPALKERYRRFACSRRGMPNFLHAGIVGYLAYDMGLYLENIPHRARDDLFLPDCFFGFYDCVITIDHHTHTLSVTSTGLPERAAHLRRRRAQERLDYIISLLAGCMKKNGTAQHSILRCTPSGIDDTIALTSTFTKHEYMRAVKKALSHIAQGDIYQVNVSQRFALTIDPYAEHTSSAALYTALRRLSPSSFSGYIDCGGFQIISSSPERFLRLQKNMLLTQPMKGTRPRAATPQRDQKLKQELMESVKERAELLMITDLARNDIGRVCEYGSVRVPRMRTLEEYATVFQTTSTVAGRLRPGADCFDALAACFPGGSITGCPKIRAMEIIEELEPVTRGVYTGSLGYVDFCGDMDFNILIRTLVRKQRTAYFHVGGGIVADSLPAREYEETLVKAVALRRCLAQACSLARVPALSHEKTHRIY